MQLALLAIMLLTAGASSSWGQTYKLVKVTSQDEIVSGGLYVFEQGFTYGGVTTNYVINNEVKKFNTSTVALQTTNNYITTGLDGTQTYIWALEKQNNYFKMKNVSKDSYLYLNSSKTLSMSTSFTLWEFRIEENTSDVFNIVTNGNSENNNRYLGYIGTESYCHQYRTYTYPMVANLPGHITIYKLTDKEAVTVTTAGLATYVSTSALDYSNVEGLKAYKAKVSGNDVALTRVGQVPAGEGVLLRATNTLTENTTFDIPVASTVTSWSDNDFIPGTGESVATQNGSNYNYILNKVNGVVGFYKAAGNTVATNRAYLSTTATPGARGMVMTFDDDATSIVCLEDEALNHSQETVVYDLQGRRVNGDVKKGLYIVNGKKVIK